MYKKQLTIQKILCFTTLIVCALVFVYSLGIMTDLYDLIRGKNNIGIEDDPYKTEVAGSWIYYEMQPFNRAFTTNSIVLLLLGVFLFITGTHSRRRYYFGNFLSVSLFSIAGIAFSVWCHIQIEDFRSRFLQLDFESLRAVSDKMKGFYSESTIWFDLHYVIFGLLLAVILLLIANVFFKLHLMREESHLLSAGKEELA